MGFTVISARCRSVRESYGSVREGVRERTGIVRELIVEKALVLLIFLHATKLAAYGNRTGAT